jgi:hypothetical protein
MDYRCTRVLNGKIQLLIRQLRRSARDNEGIRLLMTVHEIGPLPRPITVLLNVWDRQVAVVAVARQLLLCCYSMLKKHKLYYARL